MRRVCAVLLLSACGGRSQSSDLGPPEAPEGTFGPAPAPTSSPPLSPDRPMDALPNAADFPERPRPAPSCAIASFERLWPTRPGNSDWVRLARGRDGSLIIAARSVARENVAEIVRVRSGAVERIKELNATYVSGIAAGADGSIWVAGHSFGALELDGLVAPVGTAFVTKLDPSNRAQFILSLAPDTTDIMSSRNGGVVVGGRPAIDSRSNQVLSAFDDAGNLLWGAHFSDDGSFDSAARLAEDPSGNVLVAGSLDDDVIVAEYDSLGRSLWQFSGPPEEDFGSDRAYAVAGDSRGNCWISGFYNGTLDLGGGGLPRLSAFTDFLARFDGNGRHLRSFAVPRSLAELAVDTRDRLWGIANDCRVECEIRRAVERFDAEGRFECETVFENAIALDLVTDGDGVWVVGQEEVPASDGGAAKSWYVFLARLGGPS